MTLYGTRDAPMHDPSFHLTFKSIRSGPTGGEAPAWPEIVLPPEHNAHQVPEAATEVFRLHTCATTFRVKGFRV